MGKQRQVIKEEMLRLKQFEQELKSWEKRLRAKEASLEAQYNK